ncbi:MAG: hypothetical protein ACE5GB_02510 [Acidimicrobiales bacterium]
MGRGVVACLALAGPGAVILAAVGDSTDDTDAGRSSNWVLLVFVLFVAGYLVGGARAGRSATDAPYVNGATAPLLVFVLVQTIAGAVRIAGGDGLNVIALVFNLLLAASIGVVGAWIGIRRRPA